MNDKIICHISTVHPLRDPRIFYKECKSLAKSGYEVHLVIPHTKDEDIEGVKVHALSKPTGRLYRIFVSTIKAFIKARRIKAQVYHLHDPELFIAGKLFWLSGKKVIFDIHENISEQIKDKKWLPMRGLFSKLYRIIDFFSAKWFYLILAEKSYEAQYKRLTNNYSIILNTPDISFFNQFYIENRPASNHLFYIGVISESRVILQILESIDLLIDDFPDIYFHCIGNCPEALMKKISTQPFYERIKDHVRFYGRLNLEEGYEISKRCSVGLALLMPTGNYLHSYPTKIFEYMSIGMPFVTSNFTLYKGIVEHDKSGLCVDPNEVNEISEAIRLLLTDQEKTGQFGAAGRHAALTKYHWAIEEKKLLKVYQSLLKE